MPTASTIGIARTNFLDLLPSLSAIEAGFHDEEVLTGIASGHGVEPSAVAHASVLIHASHNGGSQGGASPIDVRVAGNIVRQPARTGTIGVARRIATVSSARRDPTRPCAVGQARAVDHFETKGSFTVTVEQQCA